MRRSAVAAVVVLLMAVAAIAIRTMVRHDTGGGPTPTTLETSVAALHRDIESRLTTSGTPVSRDEAAGALQMGIDRLMQLPAVDVSYSADGTDAGRVSATGVVVPANRSLELHESTAPPGESTVTQERRVVDGTVYLRSFRQAGVNPPEPWDAAPASAEPQADVDRIFTAGGRAAPTFARLAELLRAVPFVASKASGDGTVYRLRAPARAIAEYYRASGMASVGNPAHVPGTSAFEFTVGADGVLTKLSAYGTVFQDDEPIEWVLVDIGYRATTPPSIEAPSPDSIRPTSPSPSR